MSLEHSGIWNLNFAKMFAGFCRLIPNFFVFQKVLIYERFWACRLELLGVWSPCGFVRYFAICWICFCCPTHIAGSTSIHWIILDHVHPEESKLASFVGSVPGFNPSFESPIRCNVSGHEISSVSTPFRGPKHQPPGPAGRRSAGAQGGNGHELRKWTRQWHSPVGALGVLESCAIYLYN